MKCAKCGKTISAYLRDQIKYRDEDYKRICKECNDFLDMEINARLYNAQHEAEMDERYYQERVKGKEDGR